MYLFIYFHSICKILFDENLNASRSSFCPDSYFFFNLNASKPPQHAPKRGEMPKRLLIGENWLWGQELLMGLKGFNIPKHRVQHYNTV